MQYDEFVGEVQNRARLPSRGDTVRAIQATLETLAERIAPGEADDLAAQLPPELGTFLRDVDTTERFSVDDFFLRVAAKETADLPDATHHARAVIAPCSKRRLRRESWMTFEPSFRTTTILSSRRAAKGKWTSTSDQGSGLR